jgi:aspartyl protease family protein
VASLLRTTALMMVATASALVSAEAVVRLAESGAGSLRAASAKMETTAELRRLAPSGDSVPKAQDGHFWASAEVNGAPVRFLVDTGATQVALTAADAARLGIDLSHLHYGASVVTAAGPARAAAVRLSSVDVAGARLEDVDAVVIEKGLDASLLGMSYLGRLSSFQATREALFLRR